MDVSIPKVKFRTCELKLLWGDITLDAAVEVKKEELKEAVVAASDPETIDGTPKSPLGETTKPPKLVKGEHRETGASLRGQYIRASPNSGYATKDDEFSPDSSASLFEKVS